jgi:TonB-linked SusC/RagA family outer membrane protein
LISNTVFAYVILPNLIAKSSFGYTNTVSDAMSLVPLSSLDPSRATTAQNSTSFSNASFKNWIVEPQLNWKPKFNDMQFDMLLGSSFLDQNSEGLAQSASGFASEALMRNLAAATTRTISTSFYSEYRYHAVFGRINYLWKDKYIINLTGRRDGSSRFGPGKQYANFGAAAVAWIFSEENFIKNAMPSMSFGKWRISYGTTGNDQLGDYQYLDTYTITGSGYYQSGSGLTPARLSNPEFAWETNRKFETGLELGFANNKILPTISFYQNRSSSQLVGYPLPTSTGFTSVQGNFPATVQNIGLEFEISTTNVETNTFSWSTSFNITIPQNKLIEFPDLASFPAYANKYVVGKPLSIGKLYHYTGLNPATGTYTLEDINNDGSYNFHDRQIVKFLGQHYYGGFLNTLRFKGFQCDILFQFAKQTGYDKLWGIPGYSYVNQHKSVLDRWQKPDDVTDIPKASTLTGNESSLFSSSDKAVTDASFIRLKNLSLSYTIPQNKMSAFGMQDARIFILGQNLLTFSKYDRGLDPETLNLSTLPPLRTLTAGIQLTF